VGRVNYSFINLVTAIVVSVLIIFGRQHFYKKPKLQRFAEEQKHYTKTLESVKKERQSTNVDKVPATGCFPKESIKFLKIPIKSTVLSGSISLQGLRSNDLTLLKYHTSLDENSPPAPSSHPSLGTARRGC
jgi:YidC/Oxa1 family membrane protein insertase